MDDRERFAGRVSPLRPGLAGRRLSAHRFADYGDYGITQIVKTRIKRMLADYTDSGSQDADRSERQPRGARPMGTSAPAARPLGRTGCRGSEITEVRTQYPRTLTGLGSRRRCVERNTIPLSLRGNLGGARIADTAWMGNSKQFALFYEETTRLAIGAFFDVYNELGGFPEFVLRRGLAVALADAGLVVREEVSLPVWFRGRRLTTFKADLIIDPGVIIEVKTAPELLAVNKAQLMHYLKATGLELGLLFNFGRHPEFARVIQQKRSA